jgi:hypothetical protein
MMTSPRCPSCGDESKTQTHCDNSQCTWIRCLNCKRTSVIVKET